MTKIYRKLLDLMSPQEQKKFWLMVIVCFFMSGFEAFSALSILPFLKIIADPAIIHTTGVLQWGYEAFGFTSDRDYLFAFGVLVFAVTIAGLLAKVLNIWITTRFAMMRSYSISSRLLGVYLHQPYEWFLSQHSATLGNAVLSEVDSVVNSSLMPAIRIIPDIFLAVCLVVALCALEPVIAIAGAVIISLSYGAIFYFVRQKLLSNGKIRVEANKRRFHSVTESTAGVKEVKLMGLEEIYVDRFRHAAFPMAMADTSMNVIANIPRYAIEAVAFGAMIVLLLFLLMSHYGNIAALIPTLGLIAAAGMKLIPTLHTSYQRVTYMRQNHPALNRIHSDIIRLTASADRYPRAGADTIKLELNDKLELKDIRYQYPTASKPALRGLDLEVDAKTIVGIVGGTGAGKTTLVDIILRLIEPEEGQVIVDGQPLTRDNHVAWRKALGYVPQTIFLADTTLAQNVALGIPLEEIDMERVERACRMAALHDFIVAELPDGYRSEVGERGVRLSGGQRQRIGIARALYNDPSVLIFDEATAALDNLTEQAVMEAVANLSGTRTILMIAHRLSTVRMCDRIFMLRDGKVAATGTFDELVETDDDFRRMAMHA